MTDKKIQLNHIDYFHIPLDIYSDSFGASQQWYRDIWQQRAGCGPTSASNMFYYLGISDPEKYGKLYPQKNANSKSSLLKLMEDVWHFVTPTRFGVNKTDIFTNGAYRYAESKGINLQCISLDVPNLCMRKEPDKERYLEFVQKALESDSPVGFLNLSNGEVTNLHRWHWVNIVSLYKEKDGMFYATIADEGVKREINFELWLETSALGGGLVYFTL